MTGLARSTRRAASRPGKAYGETSWALRCNPLSGNLHPAEGYLVAGGVPGLAAGVYHYVSCDHALERRERAAIYEGNARRLLKLPTSKVANPARINVSPA